MPPHKAASRAPELKREEGGGQTSSGGLSSPFVKVMDREGHFPSPVTCPPKERCLGPLSGHKGASQIPIIRLSIHR